MLPRYHGFSTKVPINVSALSDARFHERVKCAEVLFAHLIKPFERSRRWLRWARALWGLNGTREWFEDLPSW